MSEYRTTFSPESSLFWLSGWYALCSCLSLIRSLLRRSSEFSVFKQTQDVVTSFSLLSDKHPHFCLNQDLKIVFVELSKFKTSIKGLVDLRDYWCYIIRYSSRIKESELEQLAQKNQEMREAMGLLKNMSLEDKLRWQEEDRLKAISDEKAEKAWAYDQGLEKGREEGIEIGRKQSKEENLRQIVCRMLENEVDLPTIEKVTGLSAIEVQEIQKKKEIINKDSL